jgi:hypothetical protein
MDRTSASSTVRFADHFKLSGDFRRIPREAVFASQAFYFPFISSETGEWAESPNLAISRISMLTHYSPSQISSRQCADSLSHWIVVLLVLP